MGRGIVGAPLADAPSMNRKMNPREAPTSSTTHHPPPPHPRPVPCRPPIVRRAKGGPDSRRIPAQGQNYKLPPFILVNRYPDHGPDPCIRLDEDRNKDAEVIVFFVRFVVFDEKTPRRIAPNKTSDHPTFMRPPWIYPRRWCSFISIKCLSLHRRILSVALRLRTSCHESPTQ